MSERRACAVIGADRTSIRYRSRRPGDHDLRERLRALASEGRRAGITAADAGEHVGDVAVGPVQRHTALAAGSDQPGEQVPIARPVG